MFWVGQTGPKAPQWSVKPGEGITHLLGKYHGNMAQSSQLKTCISWERPQLSKELEQNPCQPRVPAETTSRTQVQAGPEFTNSAINVLWSVSSWHIDTISQSPSLVSNEKLASAETEGGTRNHNLNSGLSLTQRQVPFTQTSVRQIQGQKWSNRKSPRFADQETGPEGQRCPPLTPSRCGPSSPTSLGFVPQPLQRAHQTKSTQIPRAERLWGFLFPWKGLPFYCSVLK